MQRHLGNSGWESTALERVTVIYWGPSLNCASCQVTCTSILTFNRHYFLKKNQVTIRHIGDFSRAKMTGRTFGADIFDFSLLSQKLLKNSFDHLNSISSIEHICALRDKASFG